MKRGRLAVKIFSRILLVLVLGQILYGIVYFRDVYREKMREVNKRKELVENIVTEVFRALRSNALLTLESIIHNPDIQEAFYLRERERLLFLTSELWKNLKRSGVAQFQFHLPPAISFLRLHNPEKYGDDLSKFRKTVLQCNREKRPVMGFELGRGGWGYRIVMPVFYMDRHAGSVELGIKVGENILNQLKESLGGEWGLFSMVGLNNNGDIVELAQPKGIVFTDSKIEEHEPWYFQGDNKKKLLKGQSLAKFHKDDGDIEVVVPMRDYTGRVAFVFIQMKPSTIKQTIQMVVMKTVAISLLLLIVMSIVALWSINSSLTPVVKITRMINEVSSGEGDLTKKIDFDSNDEIGDLARGFNRFIDNQHKMISEIKSRVDMLLAQMNDLVAQIMEVDQTSKEQNDHISRVATAVEEMNSTVAEIANNAESAVQFSTEASNKAVAGADVVNQTVEGMNRISDVVDRAAEKIHSLGEKSAQIGEIIGVIDDIADQTNLLALNAAIEAARAGEQGRGFAVVADEVRKLAERTSQATKEVAETIKTIQQETKYAVQAMEESKKEVEHGKELASASGAALEEIKQSAETVSAMINQIANATREQSRATEEITQSIEGITLLSGKVSEISSQSRNIVETLANLVNDIKSQVDRFRL